MAVVSTISGWEGANRVDGFTADISTQTITGLDELTDYYFNVVVLDDRGVFFNAGPLQVGRETFVGFPDRPGIGKEHMVPDQWAE